MWRPFLFAPYSDFYELVLKRVRSWNPFLNNGKAAAHEWARKRPFLNYFDLKIGLLLGFCSPPKLSVNRYVMLIYVWPLHSVPLHLIQNHPVVLKGIWGWPCDFVEKFTFLGGVNYRCYGRESGKFWLEDSLNWSQAWATPMHKIVFFVYLHL